jgi:hypothetical protein
MSTSPDLRADDQIVHTISRWLARHISDEELRAELERADVEQLAPDQAEAVLELRNELDVRADRGEKEMVARETLESVALGG